MGDKTLSFVEFGLYCKYVLRKHFPVGYKHFRVQVKSEKKDGRDVNVLSVLSGDQKVIPCFMLEEQYKQYRGGMSLRDLTKVMVEQCVQAVEA